MEKSKLHLHKIQGVILQFGTFKLLQIIRNFRHGVFKTDSSVALGPYVAKNAGADTHPHLQIKVIGLLFF